MPPLLLVLFRYGRVSELTLVASLPLNLRDPLLFSGTMRSNLDPFGVYPDIALWSAMKRAHLVGSESEATDDANSDERFSLDTVIEEEGNNLSVGRDYSFSSSCCRDASADLYLVSLTERSLVSLARALVREDARIVVL